MHFALSGKKFKTLFVIKSLKMKETDEDDIKEIELCSVPFFCSRNIAQISSEWPQAAIDKISAVLEDSEK
jgi:hypothetical protein